jgi:hypothetical protein
VKSDSFRRSALPPRNRRFLVVRLATVATTLALALGMVTGAHSAPAARFDGGNYALDRLVFGYQLVGQESAPAQVGLTNVGTTPLTISSVTLLGGAAGDYIIRSDSGETVLAPGASRRLTIVCRPTAPGPRPTHLVYSDDAPNSPRLFSLEATAVTTPVLRAPSSLDFGSQPHRTSSAERQVDITSQTAGLHVNQLTISGPNAADFSVRTDCLLMDPVQRCRIWVTFTPRALGPRSATLLIWDDAPFSPHLVPLTGAGTPGPPTPPNGLRAHFGSLTRLNLSWVDTSGDETTFEVQRRLIGGDWSLATTLPANSTGFADTGLTPLRTYLYRVRAINGVGPSPWTYEVAASTTNPPAAPAGLTAAMTSPRSIALTWQDRSSNEHAFAIFRSSDGGACTRIAAVPANVSSFSDRNPLAGVTHSYQVRATNDGGVSAWSNAASAVTPNAPPAAPTGLTATSFAPWDTYVTLTWTDNSHNETAFAIWRKEGAIDWRRIAIVLPNETVYTEGGLTPGATYSYRVRAINTEGASPWTTEETVTTPAGP